MTRSLARTQRHRGEFESGFIHICSKNQVVCSRLFIIPYLLSGFIDFH